MYLYAFKLASFTYIIFITLYKSLILCAFMLKIKAFKFTFYLHALFTYIFEQSGLAFPLYFIYMLSKTCLNVLYHLVDMNLKTLYKQIFLTIELRADHFVSFSLWWLGKPVVGN